MQYKNDTEWFENELSLYIPNFANPFIDEYIKIEKLCQKKLQKGTFKYNKEIISMIQHIEKVAYYYIENFGNNYNIDKSIVNKDLLEIVGKKLVDSMIE